MDSHTDDVKQYPHGRRGFAGMSAEKRREIASLGGQAAHRSGNAHQFTPAEAQAAGRKSRRGKAAVAPVA